MSPNLSGMYSYDDFQYALENTRVVVPPRGLIETFGTTSFQFLLVSELMDQVNAVRVRGGRIEAERPRIVSPQTFHKLLLEGFGEEAREYADWLEGQSDQLKILKYGFQLRKSDVRQDVIHDPMDDVLARLEQRVKTADDPKSVLLAGVDDAWEVCLLKFTMELIQRSAGENLGEWQRRGLL